MPPDILWIVTTQWRGSALGCHGDANARTPFLDEWARGGLDFLQAVTPHPFGPFARAALLTGKFSPENGTTDYYDPLPQSQRTIAHDLGARGYRTMFLGKWHLGKRDQAAPLVGEIHARTIISPEDRGGFDFWEGFEGGFQLNDPWLHGSESPEPRRVPGYQSDVLCERAGELWLNRRAGKNSASPYFLMVSLEAPHPPYHAPASGIAPIVASEIRLAENVPIGGPVEQRARDELSGYYAHIAATDRAIGGLLARIDRATTAVVVTSVHGDMHGAHGLFRKGWPYDESVRVPMLVSLPGGAATRSPTALSLVDLPGWALEWSQEIYQVPTVQVAKISMPSVVALPDQCHMTWRGLRSPQRKVVLRDDGTPWLFFDLESDPSEQRNLAGDASRAAEVSDWSGRVLASW